MVPFRDIPAHDMTATRPPGLKNLQQRHIGRPAAHHMQRRHAILVDVTDLPYRAEVRKTSTRPEFLHVASVQASRPRTFAPALSKICAMAVWLWRQATCSGVQRTKFRASGARIVMERQHRA